MHYFRRGEIWWYDFTLDRKRYRGSTRTTDFQEAEEAAEAIKARQRVVHRDGPQKVITFAECVKMYLDDGGDTRFLKPLLQRFRRTKIDDINGLVVRAAAKELYPRCAPATLNRQVITPMRAVINKAAEAGLCDALKVSRFPETRQMRPAGTKEWLDVFCATALDMGMPETAAIARFMFETATRVSEACRLEWKDVDLEGGRVFLVRTKTEPRTVFLTKRTAALLEELPRNRPVFGAANRSTVSKRIERVCRQSGLACLTSHEIGRHGFATEMIVRNGVDIATTADHGGWKSRRLLMETYVEGEADRAVIDRVFGKGNGS